LNIAHIRKMKSRPQPWVVRFRTPEGLGRSRSFARKTDAEAFRASVEVSRSRGELVDPALGKISLNEWSERWIGAVAPGFKPKTLGSYESLLRSRILPAFGDWPLTRLRPGDIDSWVAGMRADGLSPSRIRQAHVVLSAMLDLAVRQERITRNVARGANLPEIRHREAHFFERQDVDRIIQAVSAEYRGFIAVQGVLGLRFGEAAALRRRSVDLLHRRLEVTESLAEIGGNLTFGPTKTHAARKVPLPPSLLAMLSEHLDERTANAADSLLFTSARGFPVRYSRFRPTVWVPTLAALGLPVVGMHALRHSAAARMIGAKWQAIDVQRALGHRSAGFTLSVYGHLFDEHLDELASALDGTSRGTGAVQAITTFAEHSL
jgi:integrase